MPQAPNPRSGGPFALDLWDHLDRFLGQLQQASGPSGQMRATLEMVRGATQADFVCLYNTPTHTVSDWSGAPLDLDACARLAQRLLGEDGPADGSLLCTGLDAVPGLNPSPTSAALIRLSRSRGVWAAAMRFAADRPLEDRDLKAMTLARRLLQQQQQQQASQDQLREMLFSLVRCLTASLDARDPYTWGHSERVARIAVRLGEHLRLPEWARSELYLGGLLHDVGKIGVPDETLRKPGKLTEDEMALIQQHVVIGDAIVGHVRQLAHLRPIVRSHHERFDGAGYPDGLRGEAIPLPARIVAVADSCDAMMSNRPYRKALPTDRIEAIFAAGRGSQWDPDVVQAFRECKADVFATFERGLGDSVVQAVEHALRGGEHGAYAVRSFLAAQPAPARAGV